MCVNTLSRWKDVSTDFRGSNNFCALIWEGVMRPFSKYSLGVEVLSNPRCGQTAQLREVIKYKRPPQTVQASVSRLNVGVLTVQTKKTERVWLVGRVSMR